MISAQLSLVNTFLVYRLVSSTQAKEYFDAQGAPVANPQNSQCWMSEERAKSIATQWGNGYFVECMGAPAPAPAPVGLATGLQYLKQFQQFIVWKSIPDPELLKPIKMSSDFRTRRVGVDAHDSQYWTDYETASSAARSSGNGWGVGFVLTPECGVFLVDTDGSNKSGKPNNLIDILWAKLPGALEVSISGDGHHIWGTYVGVEPAHGKVATLDGQKVELYTSKRFIALGDQTSVLGNMNVDCTGGLLQLIAEHFPPPTYLAAGEWSDGPEEGWKGTLNDEELIRRFLASVWVDPNDAFPAPEDPEAPRARAPKAKVTNRQLWEADEQALSRAWPEADRKDGFTYERNRADMSLAGRLNFWTGNNYDRTLHLMWKSALVRDKWGRADYLPKFTIPRAHSKNVYNEDHFKTETAYVSPAGVAEMAAIVAQNQGNDDVLQLLMQRGTEDSIAVAFSTMYEGKLKYDHSRKVWHMWDGSRWREDDKKQVFDHIVKLCREKNHEGKASMGSAKFARGVETIASVRPALAASGTEWDRDNYLLNTPAGTLDLRSRQLRPHDPNDMITKITVASPSVSGDGHTFRKFLTDITASDEELIKFFQVSLGAILSGAVEDHWMEFWTGVARAGKNTFAELAMYLLGDYARKIKSSTLMSKTFESHSQEIASLRGCRLALASEIDEGSYWHEARIKELTGDSRLCAHFMRCDDIEFDRTFKILVLANCRPQLRVADDAIRSRIKIAPFKISFIGREDADLPGRLREEAGYVLQWLIEGHQMWMDAGKKLPKCAAVEAESAEYFESQSTPEMWIAERCEILSEDLRTARQLPGSSEVYRDYSDWKKARGEQPVSQTRWAETMQKKFKRVPSTWGNRYRGLRLLPLALPFADAPFPTSGETSVTVMSFEEALLLAERLSTVN